jgi:hypothetical protein
MFARLGVNHKKLLVCDMKKENYLQYTQGTDIFHRFGEIFYDASRVGSISFFSRRPNEESA